MNEGLVERREAPTFRIDVVLECHYRVLVGGFRTPVWSLAELIVRGETETKVDRPERTVIATSDDSERYLWTGLHLSFYRDGGQSYWHTMVGQQQELFVVCQDSEDERGTMPILVTADYDEAMAYHEADDTVLTAPMPELIYQTLERFVLENYTPEEKKRRKRKDWHNKEGADEPFAKRPRQ